jgi:hypothetical protein
VVSTTTAATASTAQPARLSIALLTRWPLAIRAGGDQFVAGMPISIPSWATSLGDRAPTSIHRSLTTIGSRCSAAVTWWRLLAPTTPRTGPSSVQTCTRPAGSVRSSISPLASQ